jgi:pyruvate/2-oxoglutarate dehydrogenase complex dihydrolipoamide dehydrogenase (E3) component
MNTLKSNSQRFDVVILGSGMAGIPAVQKCLDLGAKTAIVIGNLLGGTCLNVGCIPTKAIWQANHMKTQIEKSKKFGYNVKGKAVKESRFNNNKRQEQQQNFVDFKSIMEYQAKIVNGLMGLKTDKIREWGAEVIEGNASIKSENEIITLKDGRSF